MLSHTGKKAQTKGDHSEEIKPGFNFRLGHALYDSGRPISTCVTHHAKVGLFLFEPPCMGWN